MAEIVPKEVVRLYHDRVIDNRNVSMVVALRELLPTSASFDLAVGYFYVSGFEPVKQAFDQLMAKPEAKIRILMGNQTNVQTIEALNAGLTPEEAVLEDILATEQDQAFILHQLSQWMRSGRMEVKVYTGDANYFHAKSYLFQEDERGLRGSAIVGSSNFSKAGLAGNTELNTFSQDNYRALKSWFDSIWSSEEVKDFSPELIKAVNNKMPDFTETTEEYLPGLATYLEFSRQYAKPPLQIGVDGFWKALYQHQKVGVAECVNRIRQYGTALLCDGVGLGKTRTAAGVIRELDMPKTLLLASSKLHEQWRIELESVGVDSTVIHFLSKESLARLSAAELRELSTYQLVIIDEAHQGFKNSGRKMYRNLQYAIRHAEQHMQGLLLTATPWNNSRSDIFHLGRLFLMKENVPQSKPYAEYLQFAARKAAKAFETDEKAFSTFWEDLFLQRTRKTYGGEEVTFAERNFPTVEIVYEPKKQQALEDNFERISKLRLPYMDPLRYMDEKGDDFASDRLKLLFLKRADSSWIAFVSTLEAIYDKLHQLLNELQVIQKDDSELKRRFRQWITSSYGIDQNFADLSVPYNTDEKEDLTDFEWTSRENRARYVRKMTERIDAINKTQAKKAVTQLLLDTENDMQVLDLIREDLSEAFERKDEKFEAVRDEIQKAAEAGEKVLIISQFRDTTVNYFKRLTAEPALSDFRIAHVSGKPEDCFSSRKKELLTKEDILRRFSPISKGKPEFSGTEEEIHIVIGTDTLSVGQNLQDCRVIMNLDLPYNPMILEQRIGRIDRPRQTGQVRNIDIYTFPSIPVIEAELKMTERLRTKLEGIFNDTRFDDLVLPEYEGFLRHVLRERGQAVKNMLDETVERSIVPVHTESHSADYVKAQERMWSYLQNAQLKLPEKVVLPNASIYTHGDNHTVAIAKTIFRDINGQEIETVRVPLLVDTLDTDFVQVENVWHNAIATSANTTIEVPKAEAHIAWGKVKKIAHKWTAIQVKKFNSHIEGEKSLKSNLVESKAKKVAAEIISATRGANRMFIIERIKAAGYLPKILKQLSSAIEYIDSRDLEFQDVLDLHADLNRLWNDFGYYVERFIGDDEEGIDNSEVEEGYEKKQTTGRLASEDKSETIWEIAHIGSQDFES